MSLARPELERAVKVIPSFSAYATTLPVSTMLVSAMTKYDFGTIVAMYDVETMSVTTSTTVVAPAHQTITNMSPLLTKQPATVLCYIVQTNRREWGGCNHMVAMGRL